MPKRLEMMSPREVASDLRIYHRQGRQPVVGEQNASSAIVHGLARWLPGCRIGLLKEVPIRRRACSRWLTHLSSASPRGLESSKRGAQL